jgi:hypothetical protein
VSFVTAGNGQWWRQQRDVGDASSLRRVPRGVRLLVRHDWRAANPVPPNGAGTKPVTRGRLQRERASPTSLSW